LGPFAIHGELPDGSGRVVPRFYDVPEEKAFVRQDLGCSMVHRDAMYLMMLLTENRGDHEEAERLRRYVGRQQQYITDLLDELET
jgi:hypothetical protein